MHDMKALASTHIFIEIRRARKTELAGVPLQAESSHRCFGPIPFSPRAPAAVGRCLALRAASVVGVWVIISFGVDRISAPLRIGHACLLDFGGNMYIQAPTVTPLTFVANRRSLGYELGRCDFTFPWGGPRRLLIQFNFHWLSLPRLEVKKGT